MKRFKGRDEMEGYVAGLREARRIVAERLGDGQTGDIGKSVDMLSRVLADIKRIDEMDARQYLGPSWEGDRDDEKSANYAKGYDMARLWYALKDELEHLRKALADTYVPQRRQFTK